MRVHELQDGGAVVEMADLALLRADAGADLRHQPRRDGAPRVGRQALDRGTAEGRRVLGPRVEPGDGLVDDAQRRGVAGPRVVAPGEEPVAFQHDALGLRVLGREVRQHQAELETRAAPRQPADLVAVDSLCDLPAVARRRHGDHGVGMHVVDVAIRQVRVERRVDRGGAGIQREGAVGQKPHHLVLVRGAAIDGAELFQVVHVERGEAVALHRADVAPGTLDPEDRHLVARQRVFRRHLGRGVAAAVVGDPLVGPEQVRAVEQQSGLVEARRGGFVPAILEEVSAGIRHDVLP